jgi:hypothetical protein
MLAKLGERGSGGMDANGQRSQESCRRRAGET